MRTELELIEHIENYLLGKLSPADKTAFEKEILADPKLKKEVDMQRDLMEGIKRSGMTQDAQNAYKKYKLNKNFKNWGLGGLSALIIATSVYLLAPSLSHHSSRELDYTLPETNERGEKLWADADKYLPYQRFSIDNSKDTILESRSGIVFVIPANCFKDKNGNSGGDVSFEVKEALNPSDMMLAGLSTRSGDKQLETGGMFYINATKGGENLSIDPNNGIYTEVPTNNYKPGMQLYHGERTPDGGIDWIDPKPMEKFLVPVNITSLNFYPPNYLDSLHRWGYDVKDKKFTDSLYYSFASLFGAPPTGKEHASVQPNSDSIEEKFSPDTAKYTPNGRALYTTNCRSCHYLDSRMSSGPGFAGISKRHSMEWAVGFTKNNIAYAKYDKEAADAIKLTPNTMTVFEGTLTPEEIYSIVRFIYNEPGETEVYHPESDISVHGINPAKVKAIWNEQFNNTLLATKEFEERMPFIHQTCQEEILDLYVNNLDKRLSYIDSMAGNMENLQNDKFREFALRGDGRVKTDSKTLKILKRYYETRSKLYTDAIAKTAQKFWKEQGEMDQKYMDKNAEHINKDAVRNLDNFNKEFNLNLKEAYRQLGYDTIAPIPSNVFGGTVTQTGWSNVDKAVLESTTNRSTLNYTDPVTNKKAIITYSPLTVKMNDMASFDRVMIYLSQHELSSFMRMNYSNESGGFKENLNELVSYDLVCVALKKDQWYMYSQPNVKPGMINEVPLERIGESDLKKKLNSFAPKSQSKDMQQDLDFMKYQFKDEKRQQKNLERQELYNKTLPVVLPCMGLAH